MPVNPFDGRVDKTSEILTISANTKKEKEGRKEVMELLYLVSTKE
jgi:hypothetical protein